MPCAVASPPPRRHRADYCNGLGASPVRQQNRRRRSEPCHPQRPDQVLAGLERQQNGEIKAMRLLQQLKEELMRQQEELKQRRTEETHAEEECLHTDGGKTADEKRRYCSFQRDTDKDRRMRDKAEMEKEAEKRHATADQEHSHDTDDANRVAAEEEQLQMLQKAAADMKTLLKKDIAEHQVIPAGGAHKSDAGDCRGRSWSRQETQKQEAARQEKLRQEKLRQEELKQEQIRQQQLRHEWERESKRERLRQEDMRQEQLRQEREKEQKRERLRQEQLRQEHLQQEQLRREQFRQEEIQRERIHQEQLRHEHVQQDHLRQDSSRQDKRQHEQLRRDELPRDHQLRQEQLRQDEQRHEQLRQEQREQGENMRKQSGHDRMACEQVQSDQSQREQEREETCEGLPPEPARQDHPRRERSNQEQFSHEKLRQAQLRQEQLLQEHLQHAKSKERRERRHQERSCKDLRQAQGYQEETLEQSPRDRSVPQEKFQPQGGQDKEKRSDEKKDQVDGVAAQGGDGRVDADASFADPVASACSTARARASTVGGSSNNATDCDEQECLYSVLGVPKVADADVIRRAYKRQCLRHHPDKGGDIRLLERVNFAYSILSNTHLRRVYDAYGLKGVDAAKRFEQDRGCAQRGNAPASDPKSQAEPIVVEGLIPLEIAYTGGFVDVRVVRISGCRACGGSGIGPDGYIVSCSSCSGTGSTTCLGQGGGAVVEQLVLCQACQGQGAVLPRCTACAGEQLVGEEVGVQFEVPPGVEVGERLVASGQGHALPGHLPGDVVLVCGAENHERFVRDGDNLVAEQRVPLQLALCGGTLEVPHLGGRCVRIGVARGVVLAPGSQRTVPGEGMPKRHKQHLRGDLVLTFSVDFPTVLREDTAARLEAAFLADLNMSQASETMTS
eukprot:TRINITY_DN38394_c0_g1_i1.p1 TRINITY_DN38394_c0_g1~~TRINITY_DN38394_c0_g1_i1.p1  ORF type:complete len:902 (+),score=163.23 TRINITY_DN38394_c0_g1_i1:86-2791(+)